MNFTKAIVYDVVLDLQQRLVSVQRAGDDSDAEGSTSKFVTPDKLAEIVERRQSLVLPADVEDLEIVIIDAWNE